MNSEEVNPKHTFLSHVFSTTEEGKAEIMNGVQYALLGVVPIVFLNKLVQRFIPDADPDKSSIELCAEILLQIVCMFVGIILIHRIITYIPPYSEFKYEALSLTNVILAFLIIVLSIQTKLGIKVNLMYDRVLELWDGPVVEKPKIRAPGARHVPSQADFLDTTQTDMFPPAPLATTRQPENRLVANVLAPDYGPMAANNLLGSSFGSSF